MAATPKTLPASRLECSSRRNFPRWTRRNTGERNTSWLQAIPRDRGMWISPLSLSANTPSIGTPFHDLGRAPPFLLHRWDILAERNSRNGDWKIGGKFGNYRDLKLSIWIFIFKANEICVKLQFRSLELEKIRQSFLLKHDRQFHLIIRNCGLWIQVSFLLASNFSANNCSFHPYFSNLLIVSPVIQLIIALWSKHRLKTIDSIFWKETGN